MLITPNYLDALADRWIITADRNLRRDGHLVGTIFGFSQAGESCAIVQDDNDSSGAIYKVRNEPFYQVRGPLRDHQAEITEILKEHQCVAAIFIGEFWTFPDEAASRAYFNEDGPSPSQHPQRQEGIFVTAHYPLGGFSKALSRRIVRTPHNEVYTREWDQGSAFHKFASDKESLTTFMTSWIEECLPQPDDGAVARANQI